MLWGGPYDGIKRGGNIHENQTFTFHKLPGCRRVDCFAFIWQTGKEIFGVEVKTNGSANDTGEPQLSP